MKETKDEKLTLGWFAYEEIVFSVPDIEPKTQRIMLIEKLLKNIDNILENL